MTDKSNSSRFLFLGRALISLILVFLALFSINAVNSLKESVSISIREEANLEKIKQVVIELAENNARNNSRGIAKQIQIYINDHPEMTLGDLQNDTVFQNIAVQEYGIKSYSAVVSSDCTTVFHADPKIIGIHSRDFKEELGLPTDEIWENLHKPACEQGIEAEGYYTWRHREGFAPERKFMRMAYAGKTADGKKLYLGATAYVADFYAPVDQLEAEMDSRRSFIIGETSRVSENAVLKIIIIAIASLIIFWLICLAEKVLFKK